MLVLTKQHVSYLLGTKIWYPLGIRTPVTAVKGRCPRPLDEGDPGT